MNTYDFLLGCAFAKAEGQAYQQLPGSGGDINDGHFGRMWVVLGCGERITVCFSRGWSSVGGNNLASFGYPKNGEYENCTGIFKEAGHYDILFEDGDEVVKAAVFAATGKCQYENRMDLKGAADIIHKCGGVDFQATFEYLHSRAKIFG